MSGKECKIREDNCFFWEATEKLISQALALSLLSQIHAFEKLMSFWGAVIVIFVQLNSRALRLFST